MNTFYPIAETDGNKDNPTYLYELENSADGRNGFEPDIHFLNLVSWTSIQEKLKKSGVISPLIYLDAMINEFVKIGKPTHPDVKKLFEMWDELVKREKLQIKYRPMSPVPGMITPAEMAKYLKNADTYKKSTSTDLSNYLKAEMAKAEDAGNVELYNELGYWLEYASGFKHEKKNVLKKIVKTVLTGGLGTEEGRAILSGGLSTEKGRKVIAAASTLGLSETKAGQKISDKIEKVAEKVDKAVEKVDKKSDEIAEKVVQKFKTISLALPRAAFASLAAINIFGIASHLDGIRDAASRGSQPHAEKWKKVRDFWYKMGGSRTKFDKLIKKGGKKKPFLAKVKKKKSGADGSTEYEYSYLNVAGVDDAAILAWIGIATSVIVAIKKIAGKPEGMDEETEAALEEQAALEAEEFAAALAAEEQNAIPEALRDLDMVMPVWAWALLGLGVVGAGVLVVVAIKKGRKK